MSTTPTVLPEVTATVDLSKIDVNKPVPHAVSGFEGQPRCESDTDLPLSPSAREAVRKLKAFLGDDAQHVTPRFTVNPAASGHESDTLVLGGLNVKSGTALSQLAGLTAAATSGENGTHRFDKQELDMILTALPAVGAARAV